MAENKRHLPALLVIMDGFGLAPAGDNNAVYKANKPFLDKLWNEYPYTTLGASGEDVGLPDGQMGNSEVGHLNIGAGRIVFQELSRINNAIKDGSIQENATLAKAMDDVAKKGATLHLLGLVSPGGVHSMQRHGENLAAIAAMHGVEHVRFHCFMDGRDVDPHSGAGYIETLKENLEALSKYTGVDARIATVSGRYWAMDRDNRWERTPSVTRSRASRPTTRRMSVATSSSSPSPATTRALQTAMRWCSSTSVPTAPAR